MNTLRSPLPTDATLVLSDDERQPCEIWTRVMGYHRPVSSFNKGKQGEFHERRYFVEPAGKPIARTGTRTPISAC